MWILLIFIVIIPDLALSQSTQIDCKPLDPRESISRDYDTKIQASVKTVFKVAEAKGEVERKTKEAIQNLPATATGKDAVQFRWIYLFCEMIRTSKMTEEQKTNTFDAVKRGAGIFPPLVIPPTVTPQKITTTPSTKTTKGDQPSSKSLASKPLAKSTVEVWYSDEGLAAVDALNIKKRLESVGAKVSLKVSKYPYPIPMEPFTVYYRDPSNLEAAIQAQELLHGGLERGPRASIGLATPNADLTILVPSVP